MYLIKICKLICRAFMYYITIKIIDKTEEASTTIFSREKLMNCYLLFNKINYLIVIIEPFTIRYQ